MPVTGLDHVNLRAGREMLERLRDFYVDVLGLRVGERRLSSHGYWLYAGDKAIVHLSEERPGDPRPPGVRNTFDHLAFACRGLPEFTARLQALDVAYRKTRSADGHTQLFLSDPAGNGIELNFPPEE